MEFTVSFQYHSPWKGEGIYRYLKGIYTLLRMVINKTNNNRYINKIVEGPTSDSISAGNEPISLGQTVKQKRIIGISVLIVSSTANKL